MTGSINKTWHSFFDAICLEHGHVDNVRLASALCDLGKSAAPGAFESALKSLSHWRQGKHTPNRRNFRLLTLILEIDSQPDRAVEWHSLYEQALRRKPVVEPEVLVEPSTDEENRPETNLSNRQSAKKVMRYAGLISVIGVIAFGLFALMEPAAISSNDTKGITTLPVDMTDQQIYYREIANLKVGESIVVHGKRGPACSEQPPEWPDVLKFLPELSTGVWSDGGVGFRVSRSCGGATPARAVVFTATRPGMDKFMLYDDPITITVK